MRLSVSGQGTAAGGALETGGVQRLMGKQLHLQRARVKKQPGQVRPQSVIGWASGRRHEEEQLCLSQMVDIGFGVCCLPSVCA